MPQMVGQIPLYYNRHNTGRPATTPMLVNDIPVGCPQFSIGQSSYHLETGIDPLFPFGFGLSYSTFEYGKAVLSADTISDKDTLYITCSVTNTSDFDGYETAQLYVQDIAGDLVRPIKELKGFSKVFIPAHQTLDITFTLCADDLAYWHEQHDGFNSRVYRLADEGGFNLWVAPDSRLNDNTEHFYLKLQ